MFVDVEVDGAATERLVAEDEAIAWLDLTQSTIGAAQREQLRAIAKVHAMDLWEDWGAHSSEHWLSMHMGVSYYRASKLLDTALALEGLPLIAEALSSGSLVLDKVIELARFATQETEADLIRWAQVHSVGRIQEEAELRLRRSLEEAQEIEEVRSVKYWYVDTRFELHADLPASYGPGIIEALDRAEASIPVMPGEEGREGAEARRADALVALCAVGLGSEATPDRASVIVHAQLDGLLGTDGTWGSQIQGGGILHPLAVQRLLCNGAMQVIVEDGAGNIAGMGKMRRDPPAWMERQVRYRDKECQFPNCSARRYTQVHHVEYWSKAGRTVLSELALLCWSHHRLLHEYGWRMTRSRDGTVRWFWPDGTEHVVGDSPADRERRESAKKLEKTLARHGFVFDGEGNAVSARSTPGSARPSCSLPSSVS
jgi:Domain of unknown function (DUF222)